MFNRKEELKRPPKPEGLPIFGNIFQARRDPLKFVMETTRKYGDITYFRMGIYTGYLLNHPDYFQHVLTQNHRNYNKNNYNYKKLKPVLGEGLITANGKQWLYNRRLIQQVFHDKMISSFDSTIKNAALDMLNKWRTFADRKQPFDIADEMMKLTLRIVTESLFNTDISPSANMVGKAFNVLNKNIADRFKTVFIPPLWIPNKTQ